MLVSCTKASLLTDLSCLPSVRDKDTNTPEDGRSSDVLWRVCPAITSHVCVAPLKLDN